MDLYYRTKYTRQMVEPRHASLVALAALPAVVGFLLFKPAPIVAVAALNVVLIAGSLYLAMSPTESEHDTIAETAAH